MVNAKKPLLFLIMLILAAASVSAYQWRCLSKGQKLYCGAATYTCTSDCCQVCVDETTGCWAAMYRCYSAPPCSCGGTDVPTDFQPPKITVVEPQNGKTYNSRSVPFDIILDEPANPLQYQVKGMERYGWIRLCPGTCTGYKGLRSFNDGEYTLNITATDKAGNKGSKQVTFYVDSIAPRVRRTLPPRDSYSNGVFSVEYTESNVVEITLYYRDSASSSYKAMKKTNCPSGANGECVFAVGTSTLAQGPLSYFFTIKDRGGFLVNSTVVTVNIDTIAPRLVHLEPKLAIYATRAVPFSFTVSEPVELEYMNLNEPRPRWVRLCSRCTAYSNPVTFPDGDHRIIVRARDPANNNATVTLNFKVDSTVPRIRATAPRDGGYGNGEFRVVYDELNVKKVSLYYTRNLSQGYTAIASSSCPSGMNKECVFRLTGLQQGILYYYFEIEDIAGHKAVMSRAAKITIDTVKPQLVVTSPTSGTQDRRILFQLTSSERATIGYTELSSATPIFKPLCSGCTAVTIYRYFAPGSYRLSITATDAAGNFDEKIVEFTVP